MALGDMKKSFSVQLRGILYKEPIEEIHMALPGEPLTLVVFERTLMFMRTFEVLYIIELAEGSTFSFFKHEFELLAKNADQELHHVNFFLEDRADEQNFVKVFSRVLKDSADKRQDDPLIGTAVNNEYYKNMAKRFSAEVGRLFGHTLVDLAESYGRAIQNFTTQTLVSDPAPDSIIKQSAKRKRPPVRNTNYCEGLKVLRDSTFSPGAEKPPTKSSDDDSSEEEIEQPQKRNEVAVVQASPRIAKKSKMTVGTTRNGNPTKGSRPRKIQAQESDNQIPEKEESQAEDNADSTDDSSDSSDESNVETPDTNGQSAIQGSYNIAMKTDRPKQMSKIQAKEDKDQIPEKEESQAEDNGDYTDDSSDSSDESNVETPGTKRQSDIPVKEESQTEDSFDSSDDSSDSSDESELIVV